MLPCDVDIPQDKTWLKLDIIQYDRIYKPEYKTREHLFNLSLLSRRYD